MMTTSLTTPLKTNKFEDKPHQLQYLLLKTSQIPRNSMAQGSLSHTRSRLHLNSNITVITTTPIIWVVNQLSTLLSLYLNLMMHYLTNVRSDYSSYILPTTSEFQRRYLEPSFGLIWLMILSIILTHLHDCFIMSWEWGTYILIKIPLIMRE